MAVASRAAVNVGLHVILFNDDFLRILAQVWGCLTLVKEETGRTGSILKAGLHLGPDCGLGTICPVPAEMTYHLENQPSRMEELQGAYLHSL